MIQCGVSIPEIKIQRFPVRAKIKENRDFALLNLYIA